MLLLTRLQLHNSSISNDGSQDNLGKEKQQITERGLPLPAGQGLTSGLRPPVNQKKRYQPRVNFIQFYV